MEKVDKETRKPGKRGKEEELRMDMKNEKKDVRKMAVRTTKVNDK